MRLTIYPTLSATTEDALTKNSAESERNEPFYRDYAILQTVRASAFELLESEAGMGAQESDQADRIPSMTVPRRNETSISISNKVAFPS